MDHGHEWGNADIEDQGNYAYDFEAQDPQDEVGWRRMPFEVEVPQIVNRLED